MQNLDWKNLEFGYRDTNCNSRCKYENGKWGEVFVSHSNSVELHMAATCLHYGQETFEGLKAFKGKDGKIRIFRMDENAKRLRDSCRQILIPELPKEKFEKAVVKTVKENLEFVPPYGSGASLYIRPLLIGSGPRVGVKPAEEYIFLVFVTPVGPYFKSGFMPSNLLIARDFDRAAPLGTGHVKVGGNYAAGLKAGELAKEKACSAILYLDAKEKKYIDECGPANFFAIKGNTYITPKSASILPSITNKSLQTLAKEMGMEVEVRPVLAEELEGFDEVGACGTAAVISPVGRIIDNDTHQEFFYGEQPGSVSTKLYKKLTGIQNGDEPDDWGWVTIL